MSQIFVPFDEFKKSLNKKTVKKSIPELKKGNASDNEIELMRSYLVKRYRGVNAVHSYIDGEYQVWDCIPVANQPALRKKKSSFENIPPYPGDYTADVANAASTYITELTTKDVNGNSMQCPEGSIPMRRLSMEELVQFESLQQFFGKESSPFNFPIENSRIGALTPIDIPRKYSFAKQLIANKGGSAILNLWQPIVSNNNQELTLAQIWLVGGRDDKLQTIEVGWQVYPKKYGTKKPVLFIYWTADNYKQTGSYNLEMKNTFVQVSNQWSFGGTLSPVSVMGGDQFDIRVEWYLTGNAWWLYINKTAVGYYPSKLFGAGILSKMAEGILVGGEAAGKGSWPQMGSGAFANQGFGTSAYIRNICFFDMNDAVQTVKLTPDIQTPNCYDFKNGIEPSWGSNFFYGGPGGNQC
jgi:hypothetical protein